MAEYVAFHADNETLGGAIEATLVAMGKDRIRDIAAQHDLDVDNIDRDAWYPQQAELDVMREAEGMNFMNLVAIGMNIPDIAEFPPEIQTVEDALNLLDEAYQFNHRGEHIGNYRFEPTGDSEGLMICNNPYPSDLDYGIIYRLVQKYRPADSTRLRVALDTDKPTRRNGADSCTYIVQW